MGKTKFGFAYPVTRAKLARIYGIDPRVIKIWLEDIGITHRGVLRPLDIELFTKNYGWPGMLE